jgi:RNA polymerase sigma-70 factor (ECF subfamily)
MSAVPSLREDVATAEAAQAGLLYERYARRIFGYCRSRLGSPEEAEDAVQHTFLNAYRSLRTGTVPRSEAAWLFAIAENVCRERRRSAWRRSRIEVVSGDGLVGEQAAAPETRTDELDGIGDALAKLPPRQRQAILLREWQGLSYREIAAELGLSQAAVETLLFRARRSLAQKLNRTRTAWAWVDLGSVVAWGKTLFSGTAAQVAAATAVVATGAAVATPHLRHHHSSPVSVTPRTAHVEPVASQLASPNVVDPAATPNREPRTKARAGVTRAAHAPSTVARRAARPSRSRRVVVPTATPTTSAPAPAPTTTPTTPVSQTAPPPPPPVTLPVSTPAPPPPPAPPVELPALPPLPPPLPQLPQLPQLPPLPPVDNLPIVRKLLP